MKTLHPTENEIQDYCLNEVNEIIANHIRQCIECSSKAAQYKMVFDSVKEQINPTFNFNITELVMNQLPVAKEKFSIEKYLIYFIISSFLFAIALLVYTIRNYFMNINIGLKPVLISLVITTALLISIFLISEMYQKFKIKISVLNYY